MNTRLLVEPVSFQQKSAAQRIKGELTLAALRSTVAMSRTFAGGRGVGFSCVAAAKSLSRTDRLRFSLGGGGVFGVSTSDRYWLNYLLLDRSYEPDLDKFLSRALTDRDSFLDCGANLGLWSIAAARVIDDAQRVVAVEAGAATFERLRQNWADNDQTFTILHRAVGTVSGEQVSFFASAGDHASATMIECLSPDDSNKETVTTVSFLDLVDEQLSRQSGSDALTFAKLDVEGMERQIIATVDANAYGNLVILYEDHGNERDHVSSFVLERGFKSAFLADDGTIEPIRKESLHRLDKLKVDSARGYNLLAYAPDGFAASRIRSLYGF